MKDHSSKRPKPITVLVADDHPVTRRGLARALSANGGFRIVGEAGTIDETLRSAEDDRPNVVVLDLLMPSDALSCFEAIGAIHQKSRVLVLTGLARAATGAECIRAGALGFFVKSCELDKIAGGIREVAEGRRALDPSLESEVLAVLAQAEDLLGLTPRQEQIIRMMRQHLSREQIADRLNIELSTVEAHVRDAMARSGASSREQLLLGGQNRAEARSCPAVSPRVPAHNSSKRK